MHRMHIGHCKDFTQVHDPPATHMPAVMHQLSPLPCQLSTLQPAPPYHNPPASCQCPSPPPPSPLHHSVLHLQQHLNIPTKLLFTVPHLPPRACQPPIPPPTCQLQACKERVLQQHVLQQPHLLDADASV